MESLKTSESIKELYNSVENRLNSENADFSIIKSFRKNSKLYEIKKMTYNDKALKKVEKEIKQAIKKIDSNLGLVASSELILNMLDLNKLTNNDIDKELIQTIIFYQLYE